MSDFFDVESPSVDSHYTEHHRNDTQSLLFLNKEGCLSGEFLFSVQW